MPGLTEFLVIKPLKTAHGNGIKFLRIHMSGDRGDALVQQKRTVSLTANDEMLQKRHTQPLQAGEHEARGFDICAGGLQIPFGVIVRHGEEGGFLQECNARKLPQMEGCLVHSSSRKTHHVNDAKFPIQPRHADLLGGVVEKQVGKDFSKIVCRKTVRVLPFDPLQKTMAVRGIRQGEKHRSGFGQRKGAKPFRSKSLPLIARSFTVRQASSWAISASKRSISAKSVSDSASMISSKRSALFSAF